MNPDDWKELLRAAHNEPLDSAHYTAVRARVIAEIERTRSPWRRLAWLSGIAAMAAVLLFAVALRHSEVGPPPAVAIAIPPAPPPVMARPRPVLAARARPAIRRHREPLTIKLQTSDPNIVIYWIAD